jgi:hypothetical protein
MPSSGRSGPWRSAVSGDGGHTGRWEKMPFVGDLVHRVLDLIAVLGPYLERADFSGGIRGSGH